MPTVYTGMPHSEGMFGRKVQEDVKVGKNAAGTAAADKDKDTFRDRDNSSTSGSSSSTSSSAGHNNSNNSNNSGNNNNNKGGTVTSFVRKLYEMVNDENSDVVGFVQDGAAFEVKDPKRLEAEVLPKYFRHSRFQSLVRQLNFYSFKKISKERSMWIYHHALFHRDRPELLKKLKRKPSSTSNSTRRPAAPSAQLPAEEPSIYTDFGALHERMGLNFPFNVASRKPDAAHVYSEDDDEHTSPAMSDEGSEFEGDRKRNDVLAAASRRRDMRDAFEKRTKRAVRDLTGFGDRRELWEDLADQGRALARSPEPSPSTQSSFSGLSMATTTEGSDDIGEDGLLDPLPVVLPNRSRTPTGSAMEASLTSAEEEDEVFVLPSLGKRPRSGSAEFWRVTELADLSKSRGRTPHFEPQPSYASLDVEVSRELKLFLQESSGAVAAPLIEFLLGPIAEPLQQGSILALVDEVRGFLAKELETRHAGEEGGGGGEGGRGQQQQQQQQQGLRLQQEQDGDDGHVQNMELESGSSTSNIDNPRSVRKELISYQQALDPGMSAIDLSHAFARAKLSSQGRMAPPKLRKARNEVHEDDWDLLRAFTSFAVVQLEHAKDLFTQFLKLQDPVKLETVPALERVLLKLREARNVWCHRARLFV